MFLEKVLNIKKNEFKDLLIFYSLLFLVSACSSLGNNIAYTILLKRVGANFLPFIYLSNALLAIVGASFYSYLLNKNSNKVNIFKSYSGIMALCLVILSLCPFSPIIMSTSLFILISIFGVYLITQLWTIINEVFYKTDQGKRLFPVLATASSIGIILTGLVTAKLSSFLKTQQFIFLWIILLIICIPLVQLLVNKKLSTKTISLKNAKQKNILLELVDNFKSNLYILNSSKLILSIFLGIFIQWSLFSLLDFQYNSAVSSFFKSEAEMIKFYAIFSSILQTIIILIQFIFAGRILHWLGVGNSIVSQPLTTVGIFSLLAININFYPLVSMRFLFDVIGTTIQGNAYNLLYNALKNSEKGPARLIIEGYANPIGGILASLVLIILRNKISLQALTLVGFLLAVIWLFLAINVRRNYIKTMIKNVTDGDLEFQQNAVDALNERGSKEAVDVLLALATHTKNIPLLITTIKTLGKLKAPKALSEIINLLNHSDDRIRKTALETLPFYKNSFRKIFSQYAVLEKLKDIIKHDKNDYIRTQAIGILISLRKKLLPDYSLVKFLLNNLNDKNPRVIANIIEVLGYFHDPILISKLTTFLNSKNNRIKANTIISLWKYSEKITKLNTVLANMFASKSNEDIASACYVVFNLKLSNFSNSILDFTRSKNQMIKRNAYAALLALKNTNVINSFCTLNKNDKAVFNWVIDKLQNQDKKAFYFFLKHSKQLIKMEE